MTVVMERLKRLADVRFSSVDKHVVDGEIPVKLCNYVDVYKNEMITGDLTFMDGTATKDEIRTFSLRAGDVIITKDSETPGDIGVPAFVPETLNGVVSGYHLAILRARRDAVDPRYLFWALQSAEVRHQFSARAMGITRFGLRQTEVGTVSIPAPHVDRQRQIAHVLDQETARIDQLIEQHTRLSALVRRRRQATVFFGVLGLLERDAPFHDPGLPWARQVRAPWPVARIKHVARLGSGHTPSRSRPEYWEECTIPWITTGEVSQVRDDRAEVIRATREKISYMGLQNSAAELHPAGTVVVSRTASAGFSAIMGTDMATSQDFAAWTCGKRLLPRYLLMCLRAMRTDLLGRLAFGSTHRTIYMPDIRELEIPLPPPDEQQHVLDEIDRRLGRLDHLNDALSAQVGLLNERRLALITHAVTIGLGLPDS